MLEWSLQEGRYFKLLWLRKNTEQLLAKLLGFLISLIEILIQLLSRNVNLEYQC